MSAPTADATGGTAADGDRRFGRVRASVDPVRLLALAGVAGLLGTFLSVLYRVSDVAGDVSTFLLVAVGTLVVATVVARLVPERVAFGLAALLLAAGAYVYLAQLPRSVAAEETLVLFLNDGIELLTGLSVLRIVNAGLWALAATPAPTFVAWYLALRRRYLGAVLLGGASRTPSRLTTAAAGPPVAI